MCEIPKLGNFGLNDNIYIQVQNWAYIDRSVVPVLVLCPRGDLIEIPHKAQPPHEVKPHSTAKLGIY